MTDLVARLSADVPAPWTGLAIPVPQPAAADPSVDNPFERLGRLTCLALHARLAMVALLDGGQVFVSTAHDWTPPALSHDHVVAGRSFALRVARGRANVVVTDVVADARTRTDLWLQAMNLASLVAVPITGPGGRSLGALLVADTEPRDWTANDLGIAAALSELAASKVSLRGAARAADETAELLQRSMLTDLPDVTHIELVARYQPAQVRAQVGGDWYDAFVLPDGVTALVIGDVAGHDMPAAAQMGQLRNLLRGIACIAEPSPAAVLSALDTTAYRLGVSELATAVYGRVEPNGPGRWGLRWANAGHPPPLLVTADGTARYLDEPAGILLAFGDSVQADGWADLPALSTLLFYTDGLVESRHGDIDEGLDRLRSAAAGASGLTLDSFCDEVLGQLAGTANEDDVTLLAVRIPGAVGQVSGHSG